MKTFNYVVRDEKGQQQKGQIQAEHRALALEALKKRGWLPLSIIDAPCGGEKASLIRAWPFIGCIVLLMVGGLVVYLMSLSRSAVNEAKKPYTTKKVIESKNVSSTNISRIKVTGKSFQALSSKTDLRDLTNTVSMTPLADLRYGTNRVKSGRPPHRDSGYSSMTERYINMVINTKLGMKPLPLFALPKGEDISKILNADIMVYDTDTEKQLEQKANVAKAKELLKEYLAQGGTAEQFLEHYHGILEQAAAERNAFQKQMIDLAKQGNLDAAYLYMDEANKTLSAKGYLLLKPTPNMWKK